MDLGLYEDKYSGEIFGMILDAAGWPASLRQLSDGVDSWPLVYVNQEREALSVMHDLEQSEFGFLFIGPDGRVNWQDRHFRLLESRCTTSQWTCSAGKYQKIRPLNPLQSVINRVVLECQPKHKSASLATIWELQEKEAYGDSPEIAPSKTLTFWARFADSSGKANIADEVTQPAATTDYKGNSAPDGSGSDMTSSVSVATLTKGTTLWASGAKLEVTNTGVSTLYLTKLQLQGKIFIDDGPLQIIQTDQDSIDECDRREWKVKVPFYQRSGMLQGIADHIIAIRKLPTPTYEIELTGGYSSEVLGQIRSRQISDRITVQCSDVNISGDYYIEKIRRRITPVEHKCWWTVSKCDVVGDWWLLGTSQLGIDTRLAY